MRFAFVNANQNSYKIKLCIQPGAHHGSELLGVSLPFGGEIKLLPAAQENSGDHSQTQ